MNSERPSPMTRRGFLRVASILRGSALLAACQQQTPAPAPKATVAANTVSFTVKLRSGVKWHDGKALTAQDFVDMYGYTKDADLVKYLGVSKVKGIMTPVTDVKAPDPSTLVFSFEKPTPYITDILD